jgi:hypothetical protein
MRFQHLRNRNLAILEYPEELLIRQSTQRFLEIFGYVRGNWDLPA